MLYLFEALAASLGTRMHSYLRMFWVGCLFSWRRFSEDFLNGTWGLLWGSTDQKVRPFQHGLMLGRHKPWFPNIHSLITNFPNLTRFAQKYLGKLFDNILSRRPGVKRNLPVGEAPPACTFVRFPSASCASDVSANFANDVAAEGTTRINHSHTV